MGVAYDNFLARQKKLEELYSDQYYEKQHNRGKLTARERILMLFDEGSFEEFDAFVPSAG